MFAALGDSITYGAGASRPSFAYPSVLAKLICTTRRVSNEFGTIMAQPGWTSGALRTALMQSDPAVIRQARPVIVWIGGDDLAYAALAALEVKRTPMRVVQSALVNYRVQLTRLIHYVHQFNRAPIYVCTQYNPFPNSELAAYGIGLLNQSMQTVSARTNAQIVDTGSWFEGNQNRLIAGYRTGTLRDAMRGMPPIHPNDRGHRVIAEGLNRAITL